MNETSPSPPRRRWVYPLLAAVSVLLVLAAWSGWSAWQARQLRALAQVETDTRQLDALMQRMDTLRGDLRAQGRLLQDAASANRVLRDEVLGLGQRNALLEETVARLAVGSREASQAVKLDEAELLLVIGAQRLRIAGDLDGARRAYALAAGVLDGLDEPALLNLRQALAQERLALDALGPGPRVAVATRLDALGQRLGTLPRDTPHDPAALAARPAWQRLLAPLLEIQPSGGHALMTTAERHQGEDAMQVELTLARAALERGDVDAFHTALNRVQTWLLRLWPDSPGLREVRGELDALRTLPLQPDVAVLDSTLQQLRAMRDGRMIR